MANYTAETGPRGTQEVATPAGALIQDDEEDVLPPGEDPEQRGASVCVTLRTGPSAHHSQPIY
jgi:hypothetical protein